jgi:hypothetical protein
MHPCPSPHQSRQAHRLCSAPPEGRTSATYHQASTPLVPCTSTGARPEGCPGPQHPGDAEQLSSTSDALLTPDTRDGAAEGTYCQVRTKKKSLTSSDGCPCILQLPTARSGCRSRLQVRPRGVTVQATPCSRLPVASGYVPAALGPVRRASELADCPDLGISRELLLAVSKDTLPGPTTGRWQLIGPQTHS